MFVKKDIRLCSAAGWKRFYEYDKQQPWDTLLILDGVGENKVGTCRDIRTQGSQVWGTATIAEDYADDAFHLGYDTETGGPVVWAMPFG